MLIDFRELFPKYGIKPSGVLHLGANVGEEAPVYHQLGIEKVIWVEGNPEIYERLRVNILAYPGQIGFNFLVGNKNEDATLHISNNGSQSSSVLELGTHTIAHPEVHYTHDVKVKMHKVEDIFNDISVVTGGQVTLKDCDFLNLDLQGYELEALKGMGDTLNQFKWVYSEVNKAELYKGCALIEDMDTYLLGSGFKRVETRWCGSTNWGDALYIKGR
jgi:FkbM family methyltransferase